SLFSAYRHTPALRSFPTRRSSDLAARATSRLQSSAAAPANASWSFCCCSKKTASGIRDRGGPRPHPAGTAALRIPSATCRVALRSEEHTSELQSLRHLVCRLLLEK